MTFISPETAAICRKALLAALCPLLGACAPDLAVRNLSVTWDGSVKTARAEVVNEGTTAAGPFAVYFNADEDPVSANHRPQVQQPVPGLAAGASVLLTADFAPLAHPDNAHLGRVRQITVIADPKNVVKESDEGNNSSSAAVPSWAAVHNRMPGPGRPVLTVRGSVVMPTPGYTLSLEMAAPQGINPAILILDLVEERPTGLVPQVLTLTDVEPFVLQTGATYTQVHVRPIGVVVEVREVF